MSLVVVAACGGGARTASAPPGGKLVSPCVTCTPESYCTDLVLPGERACQADTDCRLVRTEFPDTHCSFGWYSASFTVLAARHAEAAVLARMARLDVCAHHGHVSYGSVCRDAGFACLEGTCAYRDGPPQHGY